MIKIILKVNIDNNFQTCHKIVSECSVTSYGQIFIDFI